MNQAKFAVNIQNLNQNFGANIDADKKENNLPVRAQKKYKASVIKKSSINDTSFN